MSHACVRRIEDGLLKILQQKFDAIRRTKYEELHTSASGMTAMGAKETERSVTLQGWLAAITNAGDRE